ncbi:hypothetical protein ElyMa_000777100 [Elysia marginata]|uniref:Uncharacterized protein n=1 Tax=Elysia marginata TaxID=1093978 RepID=A0AAV4GSH4_9GAST|nr:hypothetical protein ElyMa_000777100 [Elysia marginata]
MGDFIEEDRARLTSFNYEALAMTKSFLSARKLKATTMEIPTGMLKCVSNSYMQSTMNSLSQTAMLHLKTDLHAHLQTRIRRCPLPSSPSPKTTPLSLQILLLQCQQKGSRHP